MIETGLIEYGILGLWTVSLLYERYGFQKKIIGVIERNTAALNRHAPLRR